MTSSHHSYLRICVNIFAVALVVYEMYVGFTFGRSLFQNNHLSILIAVLFAAIPIFTVMGMSFMTMGFHAEKTTAVVMGFVAFLIGVCVQWFFQYGFMNENLAQKQEQAIQKSSQMQAHQSKLSSIETTIKANEKYATVDAAGVNASIDLKKKQIEKINALKCPDWECKQNKPVQINTLESELAELEGQRNGTKTYKEALDARTAAYQSATTIHNTLATEDVFIANVAVLMGYPRESGYHVFSMLYASFMLTLFLVLTFFSSVRSELEIVLEQKRARLRKEKPIQNDEPLIEQQPKEPGFLEYAKEISGEYLTRKQAKETHFETQLTKPLTFLLGSHAVDLEQAPHIVVAGASNQGKSSTIRGVLNQIISKNSPDDVQIVCVDLKRVELGVLKGLPHLIKPIAMDKNQALKLIEWVREEMEMRYELLEEKGVEKIQRLKGEKIPYLILIVDEGAELAEIMETITDLARKGRAAGIHIIFATQYPTKQLLGNQFMEQMQTRICHFLKTPEASRAVLGIMPNNLNAYNIQNAGEAIIVDHKQSILMQIDYVSMDTLKETVSTAISKYSKQPISTKEPSPKKAVFQTTYSFNATTPTVAFNVQPKAAAITAHASDFGGNVVQFPTKLQPATNATFQGYTMGNLALKPDENQQLDNATLVQPAKVANQSVQPDKTQQNQQGCNATNDATTKVANGQLATFKIQPPLATSEVRKLVDWALNELDATYTDQSLSDFIFQATGRKLNKGSVCKYRLELQSTKEQKK